VRIDGSTRALVTGASKGIGRAIATELAERGATVGLLARGQRGLDELAAGLPGSQMVLPADVGDRKEVERAVAAFAEEAGGLDLLVANAGIAHYGRFEEMEPDEIEDMVAINVLGSIYTIRAGLPVMREAGRGHVIVVSSGAGIRAFPEAAVYGATKAANRGFAEALRHELAGSGISLTTVFPGEIETELHSHERERLPDWRSNEEELPAPVLAKRVVEAVEADRRAVYVPKVVRLLGFHHVSPKLADWLLRRIRGRSAAPRID
jgi:short-subunit dehydrogenase